MKNEAQACEFGNIPCGQQKWDCGRCRDKLYREIWSNMSPERKAYDNRVDPEGVYHTEYDKEYEKELHDDCCSCHISAPCDFCIRGSDNEK